MDNNNLPSNSYLPQAVAIYPEGSSSIRNLITILFRQKYCILVIFILIVTPVAIGTFLLPEIYQSDAKIFIQLGRESMSVDPSVFGPTNTSVKSDRDRELNSEVSALKSRTLVELAVAEMGPDSILKTNDNESTGHSDLSKISFKNNLLVKLGLKNPLPPSETAIAMLSENLSVEAEKQSYVINLAYQAKNPEQARNILNVLLKQYLDRHIEMHRTQAPLEFIEKRAEALKTALESKENLLKKFQAQGSVVTTDGQKEKVLEQINLLQTEVDQVANLIGASRAKIESIQQSLRERTPNQELNRVIGRPNKIVEAIKDRLFELRSQEADLAARYLDSDRALIDLREKIDLAEKQLSRESVSVPEITQGVDTNYQALELNLANEQAQLQALNARQIILAQQLQERKSGLAELSANEISFKSLQREIDIAGMEYQSYRENLQRAKISSDLDSGLISNVSIIQPPSYSPVPIKPRKTLNLLLGVLLGITGSLAIAFMRESFDGSIKVPEDIEEKLGLPVLASISRREFEGCI